MKMRKIASPNRPAHPAVNDLEPVGFTVEPAKFLFIAGGLVIAIILLQFFAKPGSK